MTILFPNSSLHPTRVDPDFEAQFEAARAAGFGTFLLDTDALIGGETERAVRLVRDAESPQVLVYRGWMLRLFDYSALEGALAWRNWRLLNGLDAYALCHHLPNWAPLLADRTPRSGWLPIPDCFIAARVREAAARFGRAPIVVKDYVKSRKHEWLDACFVPDASDAAYVERVTSTFLARQGENLAGGLVLRQFVPLQGAEWRVFWLDGEVLACAPHVAPGEEVLADAVAPPLDEFADIAARIESRFWTMDVAQTVGGDWIVIELGDGGVSGLPPGVDAREFYAGLIE